MASSSSTHQNHHLPNPYGNTAAPPPTPAAHNSLLPDSDAADAFSLILQRLTPTLNLSLPTRRPSPPTTTVTPPLISLSDPAEALHAGILSAGSQHGVFQLSNHSISSQLARSADSVSESLFNLSHHEKKLFFPRNWPLGYDVANDDDDDDYGESMSYGDESFCLDSSCSADSTQLDLTPLREFTVEMEKLGREVVEAVSGAYGFVNPARGEPNRICSLMWVSNGSMDTVKAEMSGRVYPYVVGLQYQMRCQKYSVLSDSGWAAVRPETDTVLVTLGDIAQVWSNGKSKKVRGRPIAVCEAGANKCLSMTLLITLPTESTVSTLLPCRLDSDNRRGDEIKLVEEEDAGNFSGDATVKGESIFNSFSFEDYAWRIYHQRLHSKDPLARYRL